MDSSQLTGANRSPPVQIRFIRYASDASKKFIISDRETKFCIKLYIIRYYHCLETIEATVVKLTFPVS